MTDDIRSPVTAGLAVGTAFIPLVALLPFYTNSQISFPDPAFYSPLIQLKLNDLQDTYHIGQKIDFKVTQRSAGCVFPETVIVKDLQAGDVVWQFNSTRANALLFGCLHMADDPSASRMTMDTKYELPIIINQTGSYAVIAQHQHVKIEEQFKVVQPEYSSIIIAEGTASNIDNSSGFEPSIITVQIGVNNTVQWINYDTVPHFIAADNRKDRSFYEATNKDDGPFLMHGDTFIYTFTVPGEHGYHSKPWMRGAIKVLPATN